jgi:predicted dehydrogenase
MIRVALIGAGSAVQQLHLPAIAACGMARAEWIVDTNAPLVERVAKNHGIPRWGTDYRAVADVDAAIVGTPHFLHAEMTTHFLERGVHVLCEKPLALRTADATHLIELATAKHCVLGVGVFRRYYVVSPFVRQAIESEWLGPIVSVDAEEGGVYDWELQSRFMVERDKAGGGVLVDTGSHTLDRLLWWFGSPSLRLESYHDNSPTGVESDCVMRAAIPWQGREIPVRMELSRCRQLRNSFLIVMKNGTLEVPANVADLAWLHDQRLIKRDCDNIPLALDFSMRQQDGATNGPSAFEWQIRDFCTSIRDKQMPRNDGALCLPVVRAIEACYAQRQSLSEPWVVFGSDVSLLNREVIS